MRKKRFTNSLAVFSFVLLIIFLSNGCKERPLAEIKIGVIGPMTGEGATYGKAMKKGIDMAIEELNSAGGVNGKLIRAIYEDDRLSPRDAINAFNKLVNLDKVKVIIGSAASRVTLQLAPLAEKNSVVLISSISTADALKEAGDYIFRNVPPNRQQGYSAAKFISDVLEKKKVAVFFKNDDYGISLSEAFQEAFKEKGGTISIIESYLPGEKTFRNQLIKIKGQNPEIVFFPGNYEESGIILKQAKELSINAVFVGGDGSYSPELVKLAGQAAEGSYYTIMSLPPESYELFSKFKQRYIEKHSENPDIYSVYSYDAAMVVFKALELAREYDGSKIKDALYQVQYQGVTGPIEFDGYGEVQREYAIYVVENGEFKLYTK